MLRHALLPVLIGTGLAVSGCQTTLPPLEPTIGISPYADARPSGSITLPADYLTQARYECYSFMDRPEGKENEFCLVLNSQALGDDEVYIGAYAGPTDNGWSAIAALYTTTEQPVVVSYLEDRQHFLNFCETERRCIMQQFTSATPSVSFPNITGTLYLYDRAIVAMYEEDGACVVVQSARTGEVERRGVAWGHPSLQTTLASGEQMNVPGFGSVECLIDTSGRGTAQGLIFHDIGVAEPTV